MEQQSRPRFTILIKALNEEKRIVACLNAALDVASRLGGDVLLVDSLSSDMTVELARNYPIRIVQFASIGDRGCGAAVQLGFQFVSAPYVYVLDADMILDPDFIATALVKLESDPTLAGVGGKLVDLRLATDADIRRAAVADKLVAPVYVGELDGGGLYRRSAVESVGYLANRWLAAFEEAELGMRLCTAGWRLLRLPVVAVSHEGHAENNWQMMARLWRNRRAQAGGALLRSAWGKPWFGKALRKQAYILTIPFAHIASLLIALLFSLIGFSAVLGYASGLVCYSIAMVLHKKSLRMALWNLVTWHFFAVAAIGGVRQRARDPMQRIAGNELSGVRNATNRLDETTSQALSS